MVVAAPADERELQHLLYTASRAGCPVAIRYPRGRGAGVPLDGEFQELAIGKGEIVRNGQDVAIFAIGSMVAPSLEAASLLEERGISCLVVNARYAKPLDSALLLEVARKTKRVLTVEENVLEGGVGWRALALLSEMPDLQVECLGLPGEFIEHAPQSLQRARYGLHGEGISRKILTAFPGLPSSLATEAKR
jgi:1-deoxy-D-xylulose-5-phosphate synthase